MDLYKLISITLSLLLLSKTSQAQLKERAYQLNTTLISDFASNMHGGVKQGSTYLGNLNAVLIFDTEKGKLWKGGTFLVHGLNNHGDRALSDLVGDIQVANNIEAKPSTRLYQLWYQHKIGNLTFTVGQHDLNSEFAYSETSNTFINSSFGIQPDISANVATSIFPVATFGGIIKWDVLDNISLQMATYDGNPGAEEENSHSLNWKISKTEGFMSIYELQYKLTRDSTVIGSYKVGFWNHSANEISHHNEREYNNNQGLYFIADHKIYGEPNDFNQGLNLFVQFGFAPKDCNLIESYIGAGILYRGLVTKRDQDDLGLSIAHTNICNYIKNEDPLHPLKNETAIELLYNAVVNNILSIQSDLQYVVNPGGHTSMDNALVGIVRFKINF